MNPLTLLAPVLGSFTLSDLSLCKMDVKTGNINNTVNVAIHIGPTYSRPTESTAPALENSPAPGTPPSQSPGVSEERKNLVPEPQSTFSAPCVIRTTMVFNDDRICDFRALTLGAVSLFILNEDCTKIVLPACKHLAIGRNKKSAKLISNSIWQIPQRRLQCKPVTNFSSLPVRIPSLKQISQVWNGQRSATLYSAPIGKTILVAGQDCFFSRKIFDGLFLVAVRRHKKDGSVYLRDLAIVTMPKSKRGS